jgi:hypothetical protein
MTITFKSDELRGFVKEQLGLHGFEDIVKQEVQRIIDKHKKATREEIQELAFKIATNRNLESMYVTLTIEIPE